MTNEPMVYYPHENQGTFLPVIPPAPPPEVKMFEFAMLAMDIMLDSLHRLSPDDADFVDYFHCWIQSGGPRKEWQCRRVLEIYHQYAFDCARGWSVL